MFFAHFVRGPSKQQIANRKIRQAALAALAATQTPPAVVLTTPDDSAMEIDRVAASPGA